MSKRTSWMRSLAGMVLALSLAQLAHGQAVAQAPAPADLCQVTPSSRCSANATGRTEDGRCWSGVAPRMQVGPLPEAKWHRCQDWVADGELARPADVPKPRPCRAVERATWTAGDVTCTGSLAPATSGFSSLATQEMGAQRGQATFVCRNGDFELDAARSHCAPAPGCDLQEEITFGSMNACKVTIDSRGNGRKPVGAIVALPADAQPGWAGSIKLQCAFGRWQTMDSICLERAAK